MKANLLSERLLLTLWVGSLCAIGYLAVPLAFATLGDISLAGNYAGKLFAIVNILGMACATIILMAKIILNGKQVLSLWRFWVVVLMLVLTLIFSLYLQPEIAAIKLVMSQSSDVILERFDLFHRLSKNLYMLLTLLGIVLVLSSDRVEA